MAPRRAGARDAASSVAPVASGYERSLRPCLANSIAPRNRALLRQTLLLYSAATPAARVARMISRYRWKLSLGTRSSVG
jgi:hypothetical protein